MHSPVAKGCILVSLSLILSDSLIMHLRLCIYMICMYAELLFDLEWLVDADDDDDDDMVMMTTWFTR